MRLEIDSINIKDVQESSATSAKDGVLYVNLKELEELILKDKRFASVDINLVYPGDKTRILNVMDVVQPRCKVGVEGADFPGFINKLAIAGEGKTLSLNGVAVVVSYPSTGRIENGFLDMDGDAAKLTPYASMKNVSIAPTIAEHVEERDYEDAVKEAGLITAVYLAKAAEGHAVDETEVYESEVGVSVDESLPRVAYYYQLYTPQFDYLAVPDKIFYGTYIKERFPTIVNPNEILDGAMIGWNAMKALDTYSVQNNGVIKELYKEHGKTINFVGVVACTANTNDDSRHRCVAMSGNLAKNVLRADGIVMTKVLGGMPHDDISLTGVQFEKLGIKTAAATTPLTSQGTLADTILYNDEELDLIICYGNPFEKTTKINFKAEKFIGGTPDDKMYYSEPIPQKAGDETIGAEQYLIAGAHDHTGSRKIITKEF